MKLEDLYQRYQQAYTVSTDTRNIPKNALFFALKGANFNGNTFAAQALEKGASYCVIDEEEYAIEGKTILVSNVLETLQDLARFHRSKLAIPVIGLTGSNGKTTSKELIAAVLAKKYNTVATQGNLNNHIGVPLSVLSIKPGHDIAVIEMGANHQKEIEFLSSISVPDFGYITNFGKAHIEGFGGVEGVVKGKSELYQNVREHGNTVFVNGEDPKQVSLTSDLQRILFYPSAFTTISESPFLTLSFAHKEFSTHLIGSYNTMNIAAAFCIGMHFGVCLDEAIEAVSAYRPNNNRSQLIEKDNNTVHLDAYNANPSSVSEALQSFARLNQAPKALILGDMFELGETSLEEHQAIHDLALHLGFKNVLLVGKHFAQIKSEFPQFETYDRLENFLKEHPFTNTSILIKGSRGMALERALAFIS